MTGQQYTADGTVQNSSLVPTNVTAPSITPSGSSIPWGTTLSCDPGTWTNSPTSFLYYWSYNSAISPASVMGSEGPTYTVGPADAGSSIACAVVAVNPYGIAMSGYSPVSAGATAVGPVTGSGGGTDIGAIDFTGFTKPTNYTSLQESWNFTGSNVPGSIENHYWQPVADDGNTYTAGSLEYTPGQVQSSPNLGWQLAVAVDTNDPASFDYQSGLITTRDRVLFEYGRFRFTVQMPTCANPTGLWPACWMVTDPAGGAVSAEIDVVEMNMQYPTTVVGTLHGAYDSTIQSGNGSVSNATTSFNIYEVIWEPGMITWGVNNVAYEQYTGTAADGLLLYLLVNNAVNTGSYFGAPWDNTYDYEMPVPMYVQAVQVYG